MLELLLEAGSLCYQCSSLRLQPVETVMAGNCMQLLSSGVREAVLSHPMECLYCCISECHVCILSDVPLDGPFQKNRIQTT